MWWLQHEYPINRAVMILYFLEIKLTQTHSIAMTFGFSNKTEYGCYIQTLLF